jgi:hypothetical protein
LTGAVSMLRVERGLEIELNARVGAAPDERWELYARAWLSDGTLVAGATCCFGQTELARDAVVPWWNVGRDGMVRSAQDAIVDPALLAQLPATIFA